MRREEIQDAVDWTLAYEDKLDWAAPEWEDPFEDRAMAILQHEAVKNCEKQVQENRVCLERHKMQYFCDKTYDDAMSCLDKYMNFRRWEEVRRDMIKSQQEAVTEMTGITKPPPVVPEMKSGAYLSPMARPDPGRVRKWWERNWPGS